MLQFAVPGTAVAASRWEAEGEEAGLRVAAVRVGENFCESPLVVPIGVGTGSPRRLAGTSVSREPVHYPPATEDRPAEVDVMVVYTPASRSRHGGVSGIESMILTAIASANEAYENSRVHLRVNLVRVSEVEYVEDSNLGHALMRLATPGDGWMDEVHGWRDEVGADLVALVSEDTSACGIAFQMRQADPGFAKYAFCVVNAGCLPLRALTHEMAHCMGSHHDRENATGSGAYPFSHDYRRCAVDGSGFRTLMASGCAGAGVPQLNVFSNPELVFDGSAVGESSSTGSAGADNARSLNYTAHLVASFRTSIDRPVLPPLGVKATITGPRCVTVSWEGVGRENAWYRVERSVGGGPFEMRSVLDARQPAYRDIAVFPGGTYSYRVVTRVGEVESVPSGVAVVSMTGYTRSRGE